MRHPIKSALALVFAMALAVAPAIAKDHGRGHDRGHDNGRHGYNDHDDDHDDRGRDRDRDRYDSRYRDHDRNYGYRDDRSYRRDRDDRYVVYRPAYRSGYGHPGYGPPRWARGGRYYGDGYRQTYVVNDYRGYGLRAPPRGHYWRRSDVGDYLLVAAATGIIADLILHR